MRNIDISICAAAIFFAACTAGYSQSVAAIQQDLASKYVLTQPTAAQDDIVTPGSVLVLKKGNVVMVPVTSTNVCQNTYKDGKLTQNAICKADKIGRTIGRIPGIGKSVPTGIPSRTFVPGEKVWLTKIEVTDEAAVFGLFTDAFKNAEGADVRYKADLKFALPRGIQLTADQVEGLIAEVFSVQAAASSEGAAQQPAQPAAPPPAPEQPQPPVIPPPPPPPADPKVIALGQSPDEVTTEFGQPDRINKVGAKQVYVYKDMKVTFLNGKVTDIQ